MSVFCKTELLQELHQYLQPAYLFGVCKIKHESKEKSKMYTVYLQTGSASTRFVRDPSSDSSGGKNERKARNNNAPTHNRNHIVQDMEPNRQHHKTTNSNNRLNI